jgi:hypothetical protein
MSGPVHWWAETVKKNDVDIDAIITFPGKLVDQRINFTKVLRFEAMNRKM